MLRRKNGQIAAFMVLLIAVLLLAIAGTTLIGETGFTRIRMSNITDSAAISSASSFCRGLNQTMVINKRMILNWIMLQVQMLARGAFSSKWEAYEYAWSSGLLVSIYNSKELFDQAQKSVDSAAKDLRIKIIDSTLASGLIDEPKPFVYAGNPGGDGAHPSSFTPTGDYLDPTKNLACNDPPEAGWNEVGRSADGRIIWLDYARYNYRDSRFTCQYRALKKANKDDWFKKWATYSYVYNRNVYEYDSTNNQVKKAAGKFLFDTAAPTTTPPDGYDSFVTVETSNLPEHVNVSARMGVVFFFYCTPSGCWTPGVLPHPWVSIGSVSWGQKTFAVTLKKFTSFTKIPFVGRSALLTSTSKIKVTGDPFRGFQFAMQEPD
ncbi:MAG TPA: hypothetical protein PKL77_00945 [Candidatus Omnitrophota bacterium]|nr:hypothetical protein [Candidatus Omnitrophota bacterium]